MRRHLIAMAAGGLIVLGGLAAPAAASATGVGGEPAPGTGVQPTPAANTPRFKANNDNPVEQIRQIVQCGNTMYAVGTFSQILQGGSTVYARSNVFSFNAKSPFKMTAWAPSVNGIVNSIAFNGNNCADAYIGGKFSSVNGTTAHNIAEIDTTTGNVVSTFAHSANAQVETLQGVNGGHMLVGGYYTTINGSSSNPYMTSLNPTTGKDDGFLNLNISGSYNFSGVNSNPTRVYNQQLSPDGTLDLVEGDFTSVGGQPRQQIFMLNVSGPQAAVTGWTSPDFSTSCWYSEPFYLQAAAWSPDQSTIYVATTGYRSTTNPPDTGLCDAAAAYPSTQSSVSSLWINYAGCDSLYSTAADASTAYFGGHERYSMNPNGCDYLGSGGYNAPGMEGLDPANGALYTDSTGTVGYYSRARGWGADDMLTTSAGLWIASDNSSGSDTCGGVGGHSGLCFLPYSSGS